MLCTLKDGHEETEETTPADYDIEYTGNSQYSACTEECGEDGCGKAHEIDIAHVYRPEQRIPVPMLSVQDYINFVQHQSPEPGHVDAEALRIDVAQQ